MDDLAMKKALMSALFANLPAPKEAIMHKPVIVIGIGEIGSVFAHGFMKLGYPIVPVTRDMDMGVVADEVKEPEAVIVAVAEKDLHATLADLPDV